MVKYFTLSLSRNGKKEEKLQTGECHLFAAYFRFSLI
jgi:hypothetical protein